MRRRWRTCKHALCGVRFSTTSSQAKWCSERCKKAMERRRYGREEYCTGCGRAQKNHTLCPACTEGNRLFMNAVRQAMGIGPLYAKSA